MATKMRIISLCSKTRLLFSHNKNSVSPIFSKTMILPAVTIKLHCLKLFLENHFCLTHRPFVFSIKTIILILVAIAMKFKVKRNSFAKF